MAHRGWMQTNTNEFNKLLKILKQRNKMCALPGIFPTESKGLAKGPVKHTRLYAGEGILEPCSKAIKPASLVFTPHSLTPTHSMELLHRI